MSPNPKSKCSCITLKALIYIYSKKQTLIYTYRRRTSTSPSRLSLTGKTHERKCYVETWTLMTGYPCKRPVFTARHAKRGGEMPRRLLAASNVSIHCCPSRAWKSNRLCTLAAPEAIASRGDAHAEERRAGTRSSTQGAGPRPTAQTSSGRGGCCPRMRLIKEITDTERVGRGSGATRCEGTCERRGNMLRFWATRSRSEAVDARGGC
jgi:hypothetical protein